MVALGLKKTLADVRYPLGMISATALCSGGALYLLEHNPFRLRDIDRISIPQLVVATFCCALVLVAVQVPAVVTLAILTLLLWALSAFETVHSSEFRHQLHAH